MTQYRKWSGTSFPEEMLSFQPDVTTQQATIDFHKPADSSLLAGVAWPSGVALAAPFAARASGHVCSSSRVWEQLELVATPGTQLRINGVTAALTVPSVTAGTYPRGSPAHALHFHWLAPGCYDLEVLFFEPPACGANHVELMAADRGVLQPLGDVRVAYTNASAVVCTDLACRKSQELAVGAKTVSIELVVALFGLTLVQTITMLDSEGRMDSGLTMVRIRRAGLRRVAARALGATIAETAPETGSSATCACVDGLLLATAAQSSLADTCSYQSGLDDTCWGVQTSVWEGFSVPEGVNALHVQHTLDTFNRSRTPPAVSSLSVGGNALRFTNNGWQDGHAVLAARQLKSFELRLVMDFNDDDASIDTLELLFERRAGVKYTECYDPEAMQVS
jgi:hypothetical protein